MKHPSTMRAISFILTISTATMLCGCPAAGPMMPDNDPPTPDDTDMVSDDTPPEIPPITTFFIDFSEFTQDNDNELAQSDDDSPTPPLPGPYWTRAALNVGIWNTILTVVMAVPVGSFVESFNHDPTRRDDGSWQWSYSVTIDGVVHTAKLNGSTTASGIDWSMLISKEGEFTDFEWFNGSNNLIGTEGVWTVFASPTDPTPFLRIDWTRSIDGSTRDIRFTNIVPDGPENGGFIYHAITTDPLDAVYDIFNKGENNLTAIKWNRQSREGRIMDDDAYGDENYRCWDDDLQDVDCE